MDFIENVGRRSKVEGDTGSLVNVGMFSLNGREYNALYRNLGGGRFEDRGYVAACDRIEDARGMAVFDFDRDGDLDVVLSSYMSSALLLVNNGSPERHWLEIDLVGTRSHRDAIGARVTIQHAGGRQQRQVTTSGGYLSGQSRLLHFGLGDDDRVDEIAITWPSGVVEVYQDVRADQRLRIVEGRRDGIVTRGAGQ